MGFGWNFAAGLGGGLNALGQSIAQTEAMKQRAAELAFQQQNEAARTQIERDRLVQEAANQHATRLDSEQAQANNRATALLPHVTRSYSQDAGTGMLPQDQVNTLVQGDMGSLLKPTVAGATTMGKMPVMLPGAYLPANPVEQAAHTTQLDADQKRDELTKNQGLESQAAKDAHAYYVANPHDSQGAAALYWREAAGIPKNLLSLPGDIDAAEKERIALDQAKQNRLTFIQNPLPSTSINAISPEALHTTAQMLADYKAPPKYFFSPRNAGQSTTMLNEIHKIDPNWNLSHAQLMYDQAESAMRAIGGETNIKARTAIEQMSREVDNLEQAFAKLDTSKFAPANYAQLWNGQYLSNDPNVQAFNTALTSLHGTYSQFLAAGGGTDKTLGAAYMAVPKTMDKPSAQAVIKQLKAQVNLRNAVYNPANQAEISLGQNPYGPNGPAGNQTQQTQTPQVPTHGGKPIDANFWADPANKGLNVVISDSGQLINRPKVQ